MTRLFTALALLLFASLPVHAHARIVYEAVLTLINIVGPEVSGAELLQGLAVRSGRGFVLAGNITFQAQGTGVWEVVCNGWIPRSDGLLEIGSEVLSLTNKKSIGQVTVYPDLTYQCVGLFNNAQVAVLAANGAPQN